MQWSVVRHAGACVLVSVAAALSACGGGGGDDASAGGSVSVRFPAPIVEQSVIARIDGTVSVLATLDGLTEGQLVYVGVSGAESLFTSGQLLDGGANSVVAVGTLRTDLAPGTYNERITFSVCSDATCSAGALAEGGIAVVLTVLPNVDLPPIVTLARAGAAPATVIRVPVSLPAAAGNVELYLQGFTNAINVTREGGELVVRGETVRAGTYEAQVTLQSLTDLRYRADTIVRYTVSPPPGGENALEVLTPPLQFALPQGARTTRRVQVRPATWSAEPITATVEERLPAGVGVTSVVQVSATEFDVSVDLDGFGGDFVVADVIFRQGTYGGGLSLAVQIEVAPAFTLDAAPEFRVESTSGASDLLWRSPVRMADGSTVRWTASVDQPWVTVRRASGLTGQDAIELALDPDPTHYPPVFAFPEPRARLTVTVERAGLREQRWEIPVVNRLPTITAAAPGALLSTSARVTVRGNALTPEVVSSGALNVSGAALRNATFVADPRYVGDFNVMLLDLDGISAGQDVVLTISRPLLTTQARLFARAPQAVPAGRATLAWWGYTPPSYSERHRAWYFAGQGRVWKFGLGAPGWAMQHEDISGIVDVDITGDELRLVAAAPNRFHLRDPATLGAVATVVRIAESDPIRVDPLRQARSRAIALHPDGLLKMLTDTAYALNVDIDPLRPTATFGLLGPGIGTFILAPRTMISSADRSRIVLQHLGSESPNLEYTVPPRAFSRSPVLDLPHDATIVAVANDGSRTVDANGIVRSTAGNANLRSAVPATHTAVAFGLTPDGRHGLVYAERRSGSGADERAVDAQLLVVDVRTLPAAAPLPVTATLALGGVVGCLLPRESLETCEHFATVSVDPAARMAFVLGPRAAEVVPLPDTVRAAAASREQSLMRGDGVVRRMTGR